MKLFEISEAEILTLVRDFYAAIREHPVLAPIFFARIPDTEEDWQRHEARIADFWAAAILKTRSFEGNPMRAHLQVSTIEPHHFDLWLDLFEETAHSCLETHKAACFTALARRIGRGLRMGIEDARRTNSVPVL